MKTCKLDSIPHMFALTVSVKILMVSFVFINSDLLGIIIWQTFSPPQWELCFIVEKLENITVKIFVT